ncbi:MAG: hypothetical protein IKE28_06065 [Solobacterium sp.]|nr:hypothetical protein [Solobacterium sp.]
MEQSYPYYLVKKIRIQDVARAHQDEDLRSMVIKLNEAWEGHGRILIRWSGIPTENMVMAEAETQDLCRDLLKEFLNGMEERGYL